MNNYVPEDSRNDIYLDGSGAAAYESIPVEYPSVPGSYTLTADVEIYNGDFDHIDLAVGSRIMGNRPIFTRLIHVDRDAEITEGAPIVNNRIEISFRILPNINDTYQIWFFPGTIGYVRGNEAMLNNIVVTDYVDDPNMDKGQTEVRTEGVDGVKTIEWEVTYENGEELSRVKKSETVTTQPVNKVIARGTLPIVTTETVYERVAIPFETTYQDDPNLDKGQTRVLSAGVAGEKEIEWEVTYTDGVETSRTKISETVIIAAVNEVVARGTRPVITHATVTETQVIPFKTIRRPTESLPVGQEQTTQEGTNGEKKLYYTVTYTDGVETNRVLDREEITVQPVNKIIQYGAEITIWRRFKVTYTDGEVKYIGYEHMPEPGEDGETPYFHLAYADDANGNGFSKRATGKTYMGAYTDWTEEDAPPNSSLWEWTALVDAERYTQVVENITEITNEQVSLKRRVNNHDTDITQIKAGRINLSSATGGTLAGMTLTSNMLKMESDTSYFRLTARSGYDFIRAGASYSDYKFRIDKDGNLEAKNAVISGKITATSGTIGGFNILNHYMEAGEGSNYLRLAGQSGYNPIVFGGTTYEDAKFALAYNGNVKVDGHIVAKSGTIGGMTITDKVLESGSGGSYLRLSGSKNYWPLLYGGTTFDSAVVAIGTAGQFKATSATIKGTLQAGSVLSSVGGTVKNLGGTFGSVSGTKWTGQIDSGSGTLGGVPFTTSANTIVTFSGTIYAWRFHASKTDGTSNFQGNVYVRNRLEVAGTFVNNSDIFYKQKIANVNEADVLEGVYGLKIKEFEMKDQPGIKRVGVIANDVISEQPQSFTKYFISPNEDGHLGADYIALSTMGILAIQDLNRRLSRLEARK